MERDRVNNLLISEVGCSTNMQSKQANILQYKA